MDEIKIIRIHWVDAAHHSGWNTAAEVEAAATWHRIETVGWLAFENDDFVCVAQSVSHSRFADVFTVPKICIIDRWEME